MVYCKKNKMKIIEQYSEKQFDKIEIGFAKYIGDYAIRIKFKDGNLNWNDYDLIFPLWDLYNGRIE